MSTCTLAWQGVNGLDRRCGRPSGTFHGRRHVDRVEPASWLLVGHEDSRGGVWLPEDEGMK